MAMQGFISNTVVMQSDNVIVETMENGEKLTTTFNSDGSITEVFVGQRTITKNTRLDGDKMVTEVVL